METVMRKLIEELKIEQTNCMATLMSLEVLDGNEANYNKVKGQCEFIRYMISKYEGYLKRIEDGCELVFDYDIPF